MSMLRKMFVTGVMLSTVLSLCVVAAPQAKAAASAGDLIKMNGLSSVYYLGANGKRYVFPNEATYFSWYKDFSGVVTVPQSELESYPLAANVVIRPGTKLIKSPSIATVYAVEPNGVLRSIVSEENAISLWGADWAKKVVDVIDAFFTNYNVGSALTAGVYPAGQLIKTSGSADVMVVASDGTVRKFASEAAFVANNYSFDYVETAPDTYSMPASGAAVNGMESDLADVSQGGGAGTGTVAGTGLTVALASDTPAAASVPQTAPSDFLKFNVTAANDGAVTINSIKLTAGGLGTATNIDNVTVYVDGVRKGSSKNIDSNNEAVFNFSNGIAVPAGQTKAFLVRAQVASGDTNQHTLGIAVASDITATGATISGSFPITGNIMSGVNVSVGQLTAAAGNTPTNPDLGDTNRLLASLQLTNGNIEDITISSITLKRSAGTASDDDFENLGLYVSGVKVASCASFVDKYATFVMDTPYVLAKNKVKKFDMKGDIVDGAAKTVTISLDSTTDVIATGNYYGSNARITGSYSGTSITIQAGAVALAKTNAANDSIRSDQLNQEFGTIKITPNSGSDVEMTTLILTIATTGTDEPAAAAFAGIENVEILDKATGNVYDLAYYASNSATSKTYRNASLDLFLTSGVTKEFVIRADVTSDASSSATYAFSINSVSGGDLVIVENSSNSTISDVVPNTLALAPVTIQSPGVTFTTNALSSALTVVVGTTDVEVLNFNMAANKTDDVKVTQIVLAEETSSAMNSTVLSQVRLYNTANQLIKAVSGSDISSDTVTFSDLSIIVPKNETVAYHVTVDFTADEAGTTTKWGLSDATCEDVTEGENVEPTLTAGDDSGRTVTTGAAGKLYIEMDNTNAAVNSKDKYAIAGAETGVLAAIKLRAVNEDVKIKDMALAFSDDAGALYTNINKVFSSVALYDSPTATTPVTRGTISAVTATSTISDFDYVVPQGTQTLYVKGVLNPIGENQVGLLNASTTLVMANVVAVGLSSNGSDFTQATTTSISGTCAASRTCYVVSGTSDNLKTANSQETAVLASKISSVELVQSYGGYTVPSTFSGTGEVTAAVIKVTTDAHSNTVSATGDEAKTVLTQIKVKFSKAASTTLSDLTIKKIGGAGTATSTQDLESLDGDSVTVGYPAFNLTETDFSTDDEIAKSTTVYYVVTATIDGLGASSVLGDDWIRVDLDELNGADGDSDADGASFVWKDASDANTKYPLRLGTTQIDGYKVVENS